MKNQWAKNREKGSRNQYKSKKFIMTNPAIYGFCSPERIQIVRAGIGSKDFFSTPYGTKTVLRLNEKAHIDYDGNKYKKVNLKQKVTVVSLEAGFDIISTPIETEMFPNFTFWVQVKSNRMPDPEYLKTLIEIQCPSYVKKELHIWHDNKQIPEIIKLN